MLFPDYVVSQGANNFMVALSPDSTGNNRATFPFDQWWINNSPRFSKSDNGVTWLNRVIGTENRAERLFKSLLEDNMAAFADLTYKDGVIKKCSIQVILSKDVDLLTFFDSGDCPSFQYYRLDVHPDAPGQIFKEPSPHIHATPSGAPRISFATSPNTNLATDFIEFIYLNHFYSIWKQWARTLSDLCIDKKTFDIVSNLYDSGKILDNLDYHGEYLRTLKSRLSDHKNSVARPIPICENIMSIGY